jgi:hypothetical protein
MMSSSITFSITQKHFPSTETLNERKNFSLTQKLYMLIDSIAKLLFNWIANLFTKKESIQLSNPILSTALPPTSPSTTPPEMFVPPPSDTAETPPAADLAAGAIPPFDYWNILPDDLRTFEYIITTVGNTNMFFLWPQQSKLEKLGDDIYHIHSLKSLIHLFSNRELTISLNHMFNNYFKRSKFVEGIAKKMLELDEKGLVEPYFEEFAHQLRVVPDLIRPYFESRDWNNLIKVLLKEKLPEKK